MTMVDHEKRREDLDRRMFEQMAESFFKKWSPQGDNYQIARFHAEFYSLVRQIYRDAQEPVLKQMTQVMSAMPMFPLMPQRLPDTPAGSGG